MRMELSEAAERIEELLGAAERGEDVVITRDGTPAARLVPAGRGLGSLKGQIELGPDFDEPLPEFRPYTA